MFVKVKATKPVKAPQLQRSAADQAYQRALARVSSAPTPYGDTAGFGLGSLAANIAGLAAAPTTKTAKPSKTSALDSLIGSAKTVLAPVQADLKEFRQAMTITTACSVASALGVVLLLIRTRGRG